MIGRTATPLLVALALVLSAASAAPGLAASQDGDEPAEACARSSPGAAQEAGGEPEEGAEEGSPALCVVGADGSGQALLATGAWAPAWSPDGAAIAFDSWEEPGGIAAVKADGSDRTRVAPEGGNPAWSPDGTRLAYLTSEAEGEVALFVVGADGSARTKLAETTGESGFYGYLLPPAWSPDGTKLAFVAVVEEECDADAWIVNADGSGLTRLTDLPGAVYGPSWSPDGARLAIANKVCAEEEGSGEDDFGGTVVGGGIYVAGADGSGPAEVVTWSEPDEEADGAAGADAAIGEPSPPAWSPDGTKLLFASERGVYTVDADGSGLTVVVHDAQSASAPEPAVVNAGPFNLGLPTWSPDGAKIAFSAQPCEDIEEDCDDEDADVFVVGADGSGLAAVGATALEDVTPAWSPDGTRLAFVSSPPMFN